MEYERKKNRFERYVPGLTFVVIALAVLALILGFMSAVSDDGNDAASTPQTVVEKDARTIMVTGEAEVAVPADRVRFTITVTGEAGTVQKAGEKTIASLDALMTQLSVLGFEQEDLQTSSISLDRGTRYYDGKPQEDLYRGQFSIQATLPATTNNSRLVNIFSTISQIEGAELTGMTFYASDTEDVELEAYGAAYRDALAKAEKLLAETGEYATPSVRSISSASHSIGVMRTSALMYEASSAGTVLPGATTSVSASVSVVFEF